MDIKNVKNILVANRDDRFESLKMIDAIQGLGIDLYFRPDIDQTLHMIYEEYSQFYRYYGRDPREATLCFRLLRQEGHNVQESTRYNT